MKELYIKEIDKHNPDYLGLVNERGTVFNDPAWLSLFGHHLKLYGIFDQKESLTGAFTLWHSHPYGLTYLKNPLTTPHCALIFRNTAETQYKRNTYEKSVHSCVAEFLKSQSAAIIQFNLPPGATDVQPYLWRGFKVSPAYTYQLDLNPPIHETFSDFDSKLRSDIAKAEKDGIVVKKTDDMANVRSLVKKTLDRKTKDLPFSLIDKILFDFAKPKNSFAFVAYNADQPVAAAFCVYDGTTAYYILGGFDSENRYRGAAASTILASIQHAREIGLQIFDFEGSMVPSIEAFFRGFGGELVPKYSVHRAWLPLEILLKFVKRSVY